MICVCKRIHFLKLIIKKSCYNNLDMLTLYTNHEISRIHLYFFSSLTFILIEKKTILIWKFTVIEKLF